jgi:hypothetical protein
MTLVEALFLCRNECQNDTRFIYCESIFPLLINLFHYKKKNYQPILIFFPGKQQWHLFKRLQSTDTKLASQPLEHPGPVDYNVGLI